MYYVYEHWRPDTGQCFYVGKGKRRRPWSHHGRTKWWRNVQSKLVAMGLAVDVRIIAEGLTNEEAIKFEQERIAFYGRANLTNLTDGGSGHAGYEVSDETREKLRRANTGRKCSEETKKKLSALNKGRRKKPEPPPRTPKPSARFKPGNVPHNKGVPMSNEARRVLSERMTGLPSWNKGKRILKASGPSAAKKISAALLGRKRPLEVRQKISATKRAATMYWGA